MVQKYELVTGGIGIMDNIWLIKLTCNSLTKYIACLVYEKVFNHPVDVRLHTRVVRDPSPLGGGIGGSRRPWHHNKNQTNSII